MGAQVVEEGEVGGWVEGGGGEEVERVGFVAGFEEAGQAGEVGDCVVEFLGAFDEVAVYDLGGGDGGVDRVVEFGGFVAAEAEVFDEVDDVFHAGFAEAEFLLLEAAVCDAADEVVEAFALEDEVEGDLVAFFAVLGEEVGGVAFRYPEDVAEVEGADDGGGALFGEAGGDVVVVAFGADFAVVEDEVDCE